MFRNLSHFSEHLVVLEFLLDLGVPYTIEEGGIFFELEEFKGCSIPEVKLSVYS